MKSGHRSDRRDNAGAALHSVTVDLAAAPHRRGLFLHPPLHWNAFLPDAPVVEYRIGYRRERSNTLAFLGPGGGGGGGPPAGWSASTLLVGGETGPLHSWEVQRVDSSHRDALALVLERATGASSSGVMFADTVRGAVQVRRVPAGPIGDPRCTLALEYAADTDSDPAPAPPPMNLLTQWPIPAPLVEPFLAALRDNPSRPVALPHPAAGVLLRFGRLYVRMLSRERTDDDEDEDTATLVEDREEATRFEVTLAVTARRPPPAPPLPLLRGEVVQTRARWVAFLGEDYPIRSGDREETGSRTVALACVCLLLLLLVVVVVVAVV